MLALIAGLLGVVLVLASLGFVLAKILKAITQLESCQQRQHDLYQQYQQHQQRNREEHEEQEEVQEEDHEEVQEEDHEEVQEEDHEEVQDEDHEEVQEEEQEEDHEEEQEEQEEQEEEQEEECECCVCNDRVASTKLGCKHMFCLVCIHEVYLQGRPCPLCRSAITTIVSNKDCPKPALLSDLAGIVGHNNELFRAIWQVAQRHTNGETIARLIKDLAKQAPGYITLDQSENLLRYLHDNNKLHYSVRNMAVRLCNKAWHVDQRLATHGLCYFGHHGGEPTIKEGIDILKNNRSRIEDFDGY